MEIILLLILFIVSIAGQTTPPISITAPLTGTVYTAGNTAIITWINPTVATLSQIQLAKGPSDALTPVGIVATNVVTSSGEYTWTIPADTPSGTDYAFEFGSSPNIAFSGFFTIQSAITTSSLPSIVSIITQPTSSIIPSQTSIIPTQISISPSTPNSPSLGTGAIVGIAIGGVIVGIVIGLLIFYFNRRNRHKQPDIIEETLPSYNQQKPDAYNSKPDDTVNNKPDNVD